MHKVFLYGTLKEDFPNFGINKGKRLAGEFCTQNAYGLYLVGVRYVPWLVLREGVGCRVKGQVFAVSESVLVEMDVLERVAEVDGYKRVEIDVCDEQTGEVIRVQAYGKLAEHLPGALIQRELLGEYTLADAKLYRSI